MPLTFPVPVQDFADDLPIDEVRWSLREFYIESRTADGRLRRRQIAEPIWIADILLYPMDFRCAHRIMAKMRRIGATGQFNFYNPRHKFPTNDPTGGGLEGHDDNIKIDSVGGNGIRLKNLPGNYLLVWGDMLGVTVAGGRRHLYQVSDHIEASPGGDTEWFDVTPPPRPGLAVNDSVDLRKPAARMMFDSFDTGMDTRHFSSGITLRAVEVL